MSAHPIGEYHTTYVMGSHGGKLIFKSSHAVDVEGGAGSMATSRRKMGQVMSNRPVWQDMRETAFITEIHMVRFRSSTTRQDDVKNIPVSAAARGEEETRRLAASAKGWPPGAAPSVVSHVAGDGPWMVAICLRVPVRRRFRRDNVRDFAMRWHAWRRVLRRHSVRWRHALPIRRDRRVQRRGLRG